MRVPAGQMIFRENSKICASIGGLADELGGAVVVGGGVEGLREALVSSILDGEYLMAGTNLRCQLYQSNLV
jgi:hypothetical protein